jgi:hypothetical protein
MAAASRRTRSSPRSRARPQIPPANNIPSSRANSQSRPKTQRRQIFASHPFSLARSSHRESITLEYSPESSKQRSSPGSDPSDTWLPSPRPSNNLKNPGPIPRTGRFHSPRPMPPFALSAAHSSGLRFYGHFHSRSHFLLRLVLGPPPTSESVTSVTPLGAIRHTVLATRHATPVAPVEPFPHFLCLSGTVPVNLALSTASPQ